MSRSYSALGRMSDRPVPPWAKLNFGKNAKHRALRVAVFERDDFTCQGCQWRVRQEDIPEDYNGRYTISSRREGRRWSIPLHVDHIVPRSLGGALDHLDNLQTLCESCNSAKGAR